MATDRFTRIGLVRVSLVGLLLELIHWTLQFRYPALSPHYEFYRPVWTRILMLTEYVFLIGALLLAISSVWNAVSTKVLRHANLRGLALCACLWMVFLWIYR